MRHAVRSLLAAVVAPWLIAPHAPAQATEQYQFQPSTGSGSQRCGEAFALAGDLLVAGAPYNDTNGSDSGCVFLFRYDAATDAWTQLQQLFASDPENTARFGNSVAIDGDLIVVGAALKNKSSTTTDVGAAYVFRVDAVTGLWAEEQKLLASNGVASDQFGFSVTVNAGANLVVVGAPLANTVVGTDAGAAYVFRYQNSTVKWVEEIELLDPDALAADRAGSALATDGTTLLVASPYANESSKTDEGSIEVWEFDGANWNSVQEIVPSVVANSNRFGTSLSLRGDRLAVGAPLEDTAGVVDSGGAWLFVRSAGVWSEDAHLQPPVPDQSAQFGSDVSVRDDVAVIGSPFADENGLNDSGSAFLFRRNPKKDRWFLDQLLGASDAAGTDHFGAQVEVHDSQLLVAAPLNNVTAGSDWGVIYGFDLREIVLTIDPPDPQPDETITFATYRGDPGDAVMVTIEDVSGTFFFLPLITFTFQSDHAFTFTADAPNPAYGLHVGMRSYKVSPTGPVVFSELAYVDV
jgi:hypothetical protein